ncbi:MAG: hypothetical protein AMXMBFR68_19380 [Ignavibacteria bacterium]
MGRINTICLPAIFLLFLVIPSCTEPSTFGEPLSDNMKVLSVSEATEDSRQGKPVQVQGTITAVCPDEGCWMAITDGKTGLRIAFTNSSFVVPVDIKGTVRVQGIVSSEVFSEDDARVMAETMGWTDAQVNGIHGDVRMPVMTATGVSLVGK